MAVKLRLMRMGKTKQPTYRVVATDSRSPRDGRFIEIVGTYRPREEPSGVDIDNEKALKWLQNGAQPTERVQSLLGPRGKKPRYNGILSASTEQLTEAQAVIEGVLEKMARRWKLDEVDTNEGKPSGLYYLVRVRKGTAPDEIITEIRAQGGDRIINAELELAPENKVKKSDKTSQPQPA